MKQRETIYMAQKKSGRMLSQDIAKGMCMIFVVIFHIQVFFNDVLSANAYRVFGLFATYLMPFFFFIVGYNYKLGKRTIRENIRNRFRQIFRPFLEYSAGMTVLIGGYLLLVKKATLKQIVMTYLRFILSVPLTESILGQYWDIANPVHVAISPGWFLVQTLAAGCLFYAIADYALKKRTRTVSIIVALLLSAFMLNHFVPVPLPWNCQNTPLITAIILCGAMFGQEKLLAGPSDNSRDRMLTVLNVITAQGIVTMIEFIWPMSGTLAGGCLSAEYGAIDIIPSFILAVCGAYVMVNLGKLLEKIPLVRDGLLWLGYRTLPILLVHKGFGYLIGDVFGLLRDGEPGTGTLSNGRIITVLDFAAMILYLIIWEVIKKKLAERKKA